MENGNNIWKPQLLAGILSLLIIAVVAMLSGYNEVATACPAGIVALGIKLLES